MEQNRLKSPVVWGGILAQILSILMLMGVVNVAQQEVINNVVAAVLQLLVLFGILNNPVTSDKF